VETAAQAAAAPVPAPVPAPQQAASAAAEPEAPAAAPQPGALPPIEGIQTVRQMFEGGLSRVRWPMYVRNVKQFVRSIDATFDERRYGFGGILDLLRGCQREGVFRLERDRQGVLRVFPGPVLQRQAGEPAGAASRPEVEAVVPEVVGEAAPVVVEAEVVADTVTAPLAAAAASGEPQSTREAASVGEQAPSETEEEPAEERAAAAKSRRRRPPANTRKAPGAARKTTRSTTTAARTRSRKRSE
ncbi:MAG: hypothetical protein ACM3NQ_22175, partial [Bacteroidales bacterium]